ncbi:hypothetical protein M2G70_07445 [Vibrio vulnificus]|nr:hypothetical protein [Vibrio vulnificus]
MNKEQFLKMGLQPKKVFIKSLGVDVQIRELSYAGVAAIAGAKNPVDRAILSVIFSMCDENNTLIFTLDDAQVIAETFSYITIQEISSEIQKITAISDAETVK